MQRQTYKRSAHECTNLQGRRCQLDQLEQKAGNQVSSTVLNCRKSEMTSWVLGAIVVQKAIPTRYPVWINCRLKYSGASSPFTILHGWYPADLSACHLSSHSRLFSCLRSSALFNFSSFLNLAASLWAVKNPTLLSEYSHCFCPSLDSSVSQISPSQDLLGCMFLWRQCSDSIQFPKLKPRAEGKSNSPTPVPLLD